VEQCLQESKCCGLEWTRNDEVTQSLVLTEGAGCLVSPAIGDKVRALARSDACHQLPAKLMYHSCLKRKKECNIQLTLEAWLAAGA
jgi:hypothetical protein